MPAFDRIVQDVDEGFHIGKFFEVAEEFSQKEAYRVIGRCQDGILARHNGADERKINQRSYESGKAAQDPAVGIDFDMSALIRVF